MKFNWNILFLSLLICGSIGYFILDYIESRPYEGELSVIKGTVQKSAFVSRGTITGQSFTRLYLDDRRAYRMPLGEMILLQKGDRVSLSIPKEQEHSNIEDIIVIEYDIQKNGVR